MLRMSLLSYRTHNRAHSELGISASVISGENALQGYPRSPNDSNLCQVDKTNQHKDNKSSLSQNDCCSTVVRFCKCAHRPIEGKDDHIWPFLTDLLSVAAIGVEATRKQSSHPGSN